MYRIVKNQCTIFSEMQREPLKHLSNNSSGGSARRTCTFVFRSPQLYQSFYSNCIWIVFANTDGPSQFFTNFVTKFCWFKKIEIGRQGDWFLKWVKFSRLNSKLYRVTYNFPTCPTSLGHVNTCIFHPNDVFFVHTFGPLSHISELLITKY